MTTNQRKQFKRKRWGTSSNSVIVMKKKPIQPVEKKKKRKRKNKPFSDWELYDEIKPKVEALLPKRTPYKIGLDKEIIGLLIDQYEGRRTKAAKAIRHVFAVKAHRYDYLQSGRDARFRYGLNGEKTPINEECKKIFKAELKKYINHRRKYYYYKKKVKHERKVQRLA